MILDLGAPVSLTGKEWMSQYLGEYGLKIKDLKMQEWYKIIRYGPSKQYVSREMVELPLIIRRLDGKDDVLRVFTLLVEADVPFLCGKRTIENWNSKIDTMNKMLQTEMYGVKNKFRMINTGGNQVGIELNQL